jgi:hypothetical protein
MNCMQSLKSQLAGETRARQADKAHRLIDLIRAELCSTGKGAP